MFWLACRIGLLEWTRTGNGSETVTHVNNHSPFPAELFSYPDPDGQEIQLLIISATYAHVPGRNSLEPPTEQRTIQVADEYFGDPAIASVRYEAEVASEKTYVDLIVNGTAHAPRGLATPEMTVELAAGKIRKRVRVVGDRYRSVLGISSPQPFISMPLIYERAYGGTDAQKSAVWKKNPVGLGFHGVRSQCKDILTEYPNLEPDDGPIESSPAAFGIVARGWSPRLEFAGTFDEAWIANQWPLMPRDFDIRHNQAAPLDQQVASLSMEDPVRLVNFTPDGCWEFKMPSATPQLWLMCDGGKRAAAPRMDTVLIEPDHRRVTLTYRLNLSKEKGTDRIREVIVGSVTPGYLRAKEKHKPYVHPKDLSKFSESLLT